MSETALNDIRSIIVSAFGGYPLPSPERLIDHRNEPDPVGEKRIRTALAGRRWQDLDASFLEEHWASFLYLSPEAYRYYLAALLLRALDDPGSGDLMHTAVSSLLPSFWALYYKGEDSDFRDKQSALTDEQYRAVCAFLGFARDQCHKVAYAAGQALRWGWNAVPTPALAAAQEEDRHLRSYNYTIPNDAGLRRLHEEVVEAFAGGIYPGDHSLCGSDLGDEPAEYAMEFRGLDWRTIHPDFLARHYPALSFLSDAAYRYYLPAFLLAALGDQEYPWGMADRLAPTCDDPDMFLWQKQRWSGLTQGQVQAIRSYLTSAVNAMREEHVFEPMSAQTALEYWSGTPYEDLLCRQPPVAEAEVTLIEAHGLEGGVPMFSGFRCLFEVEGLRDEVRITFPTPDTVDAPRWARPGTMVRAMLTPPRASPLLSRLSSGLYCEGFLHGREVLDARILKVL